MEAIQTLNSNDSGYDNGQGFGIMREALKKHETEIAAIIADTKRTAQDSRGWIMYAAAATGALAAIGLAAFALRSRSADRR